MDLIPDCQSYGMSLYRDRLLTFHNWPKQLFPDKYALAKAGFYYTGQSDVTVCFSCHLKVGQCESYDQPWEEHKRLSPRCNYLMMVCGGDSDYDEHS